MIISLSICIPTYNRARYLVSTLSSIAEQVTDEVEVVIADNASTDDTEAVVASLKPRFPHLTYFRWPNNMGADRNFLKVIEVARGDYCWFLGSDDKIEDGGIAKVLDCLHRYSNLSGISVNVQAYDTELANPLTGKPPTDLKGDQLFEDADASFSVLGAWFGYISAQIVNRKLWSTVVESNDTVPYHNAYVHVWVIAKMLQGQPRWLYCHDKCVGWRSGNDSFLADGRLNRLAIDVVGYEKIGGDVFGRSSQAYHDLMRTVATRHVRSALLGAKAAAAPSSFHLHAARLIVPAYWRYLSFWLKTAPVLIMPRPFFFFIRTLYRATLKRWR
jgi:abequosyltransferase